ncbi:hypothetical protein [Luteolibacter sp. LG18]|uniref:hypothetical protein n=1 Tax=Luteolibacter sp. LG18 TaxID=2819286 RepID=UPI002B2BBDB3|nr:hypothetical protein llg_05560 [Luteolibacter sp. LG18]
MRILKAIGGAVVAVVMGGALVSCSTEGYPMTPEGLQARGLKPGEGYIVASFHETTVKPDGEVETHYPSSSRAQVWIKGPTGANDVTASLQSLQSGNGGNPHFNGSRRSEVLAIPMPAGRYSISGWRIDGGAVLVSNRLPMDAPFEVKAGEATYVGRMNAITFIGRNLVGLPVFSRGLVLVTDDYEKDKARIAKTYPTIKASTIRRSNVPTEYLKEMKRVADTPLTGMEKWFTWD